MKILILVVSLSLCGITKATNCYYSSETGDNSQTSTARLHAVTDRKAISAVDISVISPNNHFLFNLNQSFYGTVALNNSVVTNNPIFKIHFRAPFQP